MGVYEILIEKKCMYRFMYKPKRVWMGRGGGGGVQMSGHLSVVS